MHETHNIRTKTAARISPAHRTLLWACAVCSNSHAQTARNYQRQTLCQLWQRALPVRRIFERTHTKQHHPILHSTTHARTLWKSSKAQEQARLGKTAATDSGGRQKHAQTYASTSRNRQHTSNTHRQHRQSHPSSILTLWFRQQATVLQAYKQRKGLAGLHHKASGIHGQRCVRHCEFHYPRIYSAKHLHRKSFAHCLSGQFGWLAMKFQALQYYRVDNKQLLVHSRTKCKG